VGVELNEAGFGRRLLVWQAALAASGMAAWMVARGTSFALSFLVGALMSSSSFWLLHRLVFSGGTGQKPGGAAVLGAFRLLLIGGAISVIITSYGLHRNAAGSGILVVVVSILLELVREHLHGT
jgi:ATP synthase I chain